MLLAQKVVQLEQHIAMLERQCETLSGEKQVLKTELDRAQEQIGHMYQPQEYLVRLYLYLTISIHTRRTYLLKRDTPIID